MKPLGWLALAVGGWYLWKQLQGASTPSLDPQFVASLPPGSAAVVLTQPPVSQPVAWPTFPATLNPTQPFHGIPGLTVIPKVWL